MKSFRFCFPGFRHKIHAVIYELNFGFGYFSSIYFDSLVPDKCVHAKK